MNPYEDKDFDLITAFALRYAMGRQSYAVSVTQEWLKRYWQHPVIQSRRAVYLSDIADHIEDNEGYEPYYVRQSWIDLYNYLKQN